MYAQPNPRQQDNVPDTGETAFKKWTAAVDIAVDARSIAGVYEQPDQPYRDWFKEGLSADEAANMALAEAGFEDGAGAMSDDFDLFYGELGD